MPNASRGARRLTHTTRGNLQAGCEDAAATGGQSCRRCSSPTGARSQSASSGPAATPATARSRSTPSRTATPVTSGWPMRRMRSVEPRRPTPTSTSRRLLRRRAFRSRRRAPRIRLPVGKRAFRRGGHRRRPHLDRTQSAGDPRPRRQGDRPAHRDARRRPAGARHARSGQRAGRRAGVRGRARFAGGDQSRVRRWRAGVEGCPHDGGDPRAIRECGAGGAGRIRPRRVLRRAVSGQAAPRRGPGAGRSARQRHRRRNPGLLPTAPASEAGRGSARAVPQ